MSVTPRASGFWSDSGRMSYFGDEDDDEDVGLVDRAEDDAFEDVHDGRTPLDRTIDRIGMGSYQWTLLSLCGFGWLADNMWIQAVAIILPRVQQHFDVPDSYIGTLSSSMFAGMMFGAIGWGTCSDLIGRTTAFNATLFLTSVFGVLAAIVNTFPTLCLALFLLGSSVGGSMPTDGTLLLEHMPNGKQYLVTALSVFFSFGSVFSAVVGLVVIPGRSCPPKPAECDVATQNTGWKYLLAALGFITLLMFLARMVFFRLHESPRYLVHAGRHQEAVESLQLISKFNGSELNLDVEDVRDHLHPSEIRAADPEAGSSRSPANGQVVFDADSVQSPPIDEAQRKLVSQRSSSNLRDSPDSALPDYNATGAPNVSLNNHAFQTPVLTTPQLEDVASPENPYLKDTSRRHSVASVSTTRSRRALHSREPSSASKSKLYSKLPRFIARPLYAWVDRVAMVLAPEWFRTTILVWIVWCAMSLAYTMFNVYLPKLLEGRGNSGDNSTPKSLSDSLWDVVIYSIGGCPGAVLGAYLVDSSMGRRWTLAGSTFVTALFCVLFILAQSAWTVRASTIGISLSATAMWAVLYGWTPEIFGTKVRGTACGIASALSRIGGMIAPLLGGALLMVDASFPVIASIVIFVVAGFSVLLLRESPGERGPRGAAMH